MDGRTTETSATTPEICIIIQFACIFLQKLFYYNFLPVFIPLSMFFFVVEFWGKERIQFFSVKLKLKLHKNFLFLFFFYGWSRAEGAELNTKFLCAAGLETHRLMHNDNAFSDFRTGLERFFLTLFCGQRENKRNQEKYYFSRKEKRNITCDDSNYTL